MHFIPITLALTHRAWPPKINSIISCMHVRARGIIIYVNKTLNCKKAKSINTLTKDKQQKTQG